MNVVVNGLMTSYQKVGKGKTLLFLHGWGDSAKTFSKLVEQLQDDYEILALDMPGFGGTQPPPNAWGNDDYVQFVKDWLDKIKAGKLHAVIGHSYGGAVAIAGVADNHIKADKLVLLASAGIRNKRTIRKKTLKAVAKAARLPLYLLPAAQRQKLKKRLYKTSGSEVMLIPHMELTFRRIIGEDIQALAGNVKVPTLLVYGDKDKDTPAGDGRVFNHLIPGSKLEVVNAGHFLHQEQDKQVAGLIKKFLEAKP